MTREETKQLITVMQAYVDGKQIQYTDVETEDWTDTESPEWKPEYDYRVKPKPTYRPYRNLKECFRDMKNHEPFGYIRQKQKGDLEFIIGTLTDGGEYLKLSVSHISRLNTVFERYTYFDGSPFGIKIERNS